MLTTCDSTFGFLGCALAGRAIVILTGQVLYPLDCQNRSVIHVKLSWRALCTDIQVNNINPTGCFLNGIC